MARRKERWTRARQDHNLLVSTLSFDNDYASVNGDIFNELYDESGSSVEKTRVIESQ